MRHPLPLLPVTMVGSWPRRRELLLAQRRLQAGTWIRWTSAR